MSPRKIWSREESLVAFNLYCRIPFGTIHIHNPRIIALAKLLGRSVGAVSLKLANFARFDPSLQKRGIKGMPHGAKLEKEIWNEFENNPEKLALESEIVYLILKEKGAKDFDKTKLKQGAETEIVASAKRRLNQDFFRDSVLSAYNFKCCITGLAIPDLLIASHIIPWSRDKKNRLNPSNGLSLNMLHDKAFDNGLISIDPRGKVWHSKQFKRSITQSRTGQWLKSFEGKSLNKPTKFLPKPELLEVHFDFANKANDSREFRSFWKSYIAS